VAEVAWPGPDPPGSVSSGAFRPFSASPAINVHIAPHRSV